MSTKQAKLVDRITKSYFKAENGGEEWDGRSIADTIKRFDRMMRRKEQECRRLRRAAKNLLDRRNAKVLARARRIDVLTEAQENLISSVGITADALLAIRGAL